MADTDLADLVRLGLSWTLAGRYFVLCGGTSLPFAGGQLPRLKPGDFVGVPGVVRTGEPTVTRGVVQGGGVRGVAGGIHPVLGLLERLEVQTGTSTVRDAETGAREMLYEGPGVLLAGGSDLALSPFAPVEVGQLVPGAVCVVAGAGAALWAETAAVLAKVSGQWTADVGERISVTFTAAGTVRA